MKLVLVIRLAASSLVRLVRCVLVVGLVVCARVWCCLGLRATTIIVRLARLVCVLKTKQTVRVGVSAERQSLRSAIFGVENSKRAFK